MKNVQARILETNLIAPFVTPEQLHEYDLVIHPVSGAQALGDPIERDPALVKVDLDNGWTRDWVASGAYGVVASYDEKAKEWNIDLPATERKRQEIRQARKKRGVPFRQWWQQEREKVLAREKMAEAVLDMWRTSMSLSPNYGQQIRAFWQLPQDFTF